MTDPFDDLQKLRDRCSQALADRGLVVERFLVEPSSPSGDRQVTLILSSDQEWEPTEPPADTVFDGLVHDQRVAEFKQRSTNLEHLWNEL